MLLCIYIETRKVFENCEFYKMKWKCSLFFWGRDLGNILSRQIDTLWDDFFLKTFSFLYIIPFFLSCRVYSLRLQKKNTIIFNFKCRIVILKEIFMLFSFSQCCIIYSHIHIVCTQWEMLMMIIIFFRDIFNLCGVFSPFPLYLFIPIHKLTHLGISN